jgi:hypothetical protein
LLYGVYLSIAATLIASVHKYENSFFGILALVIATQCKTKSPNDNGNTTTSSKPSRKELTTPSSDTITKQFFAGHELMTQDLVQLKIIDTSLTTPLNEACYCDTTVQLNDNIFYSIVSVNDEAGVCTYFFVTSLNKKSGKIVASKYLHSACDVDYSWNTYELRSHTVISNNKIQVIKTTVFQKKNRTSPNEEENIDHKKEQKIFITISEFGQISDSK